MGPSSYSLIDACRSCRGKDLVRLYAVDGTPVAGIYYDYAAVPVDVKAPMTLVFCQACGLMQLKETISPDIYRDYSFVGDSAAVYQEHLADVAAFLVEERKLSGKTVFEIGASNGILLKYLAEKGGNRVSGVEPSQKLCEYAAGIGIDVMQGYFNEAFVAQEKIGLFDCVIIRHVLEHIDDLNGMVHSVKSVMAPDGLLLVEVPDVEKIVNDNLFSNVFHEHLNYFSARSLNGLMARHGFHAVYQKNVEIHGGSLLLLYKIGTGSSGAAASSLHHLGAFAEKARSYYEAIHDRVLALNRQGKVVHGYGASHRTFILLGNARLTEADIPVIYDSNSMLHGKRLNGFHMPVQPKEAITVNKPDALVIFATSYEKEITDYLKNECRFEGEIISLRYEALCEK